MAFATSAAVSASHEGDDAAWIIFPLPLERTPLSPH